MMKRASRRSAGRTVAAMTEGRDDWIQDLMWVRRPAGTHLSDSRTSDGRSPLARDDETGELAGHATLHPAEDRHVYGHLLSEPEPKSSVLAELIATALLVGALKGAEKLAPHARRLWEERTLPAIMAKWSRLTGSLKKVQAAPADELFAATESVSAGAALELTAVPASLREPMTSAEARERLAAALVARAFSDEQFRRLREARIEDPDGAKPAELDAALSPEQVEAAVVRMLESDPSLLERLLGRSLQVQRELER